MDCRVIERYVCRPSTDYGTTTQDHGPEPGSSSHCADLLVLALLAFRNLPRGRSRPLVNARQRRRRHLLPRQQCRRRLARICRLPPGSRCPARQCRRARRQAAAQSRRIHAEQSDPCGRSHREALLNEDAIFQYQLARISEGRHHLAARNRKGGARRGRQRSSQGPREAAGQDGFDPRRRQPLARDHRRQARWTGSAAISPLTEYRDEK